MATSRWLNNVMQLLYSTDCSLQLLACKAILNGPPPDLTADDVHDALDLSALLDLAATHHPYENATQRLKNIASSTEDSELAVLARDAAVALEQKRPVSKTGRRCLRQGCKEMVQVDTCQTCKICHVAFYCSAKCKHVAKLADHASCYVSRLHTAGPYKQDAVLYLIALLGYGKYWLHRTRALSLLAHHLGGPVPERTPSRLEPYDPTPAEARLICRNGLAPALGLFLAQLRKELTDRHRSSKSVWPDEWLELEDPGALEWGLGAVALRAVWLVKLLLTPRPPELSGVEWTEHEVATRAESLLRVGLADPYCRSFAAGGASAGGVAGGVGGGGVGGGGSYIAGLPQPTIEMIYGGVTVLSGLVELCINACPSFPRAARAAAMEAVICLHLLHVSRTAGPGMQAAAAGCMSYISPDGLEALLTWEPPKESKSGGVGGGSGGGGRAGGSGSGGGRAAMDMRAEASRREVALQCLFKLLAKAYHHFPAFRVMLRMKWHVIMAVARRICAPPPSASSSSPAVAASGGGSGSGGGSARAARSGSSRVRSCVSPSSSSSSVAAAALLLEGFGELVATCCRYGTLESSQLADAQSFLLDLAGVTLTTATATATASAPGGGSGSGSTSGSKAQSQSLQKQQQPAGGDPLRDAALGALPALAESMSRTQVLELLTHMVQGGTPTSSSASAASCSSRRALSWPASCRLQPRGVSLLMAWLKSGPDRAVAAGDDDDDGDDSDQEEGTVHSVAVQVTKLYEDVRQPLWNSVRHIEEELRSAASGNGSTASGSGRGGQPSSRASPALLVQLGSAELDELLQLAVQLQTAMQVVGRSEELAADMASAGVAPALARCAFLSRHSTVDTALTLLAAACWPAALDMPWPPPPTPVPDPRDFGGCLSQGCRAVAEALQRPQRVPVAQPQPQPQQASAATSQLRFVDERPWERVLRLATDPRVGGTEQEVQQLAALRLVAVLVACADPATSLGLLADPRMASALLAVGDMLPGNRPQPQPARQQRPGSDGGGSAAAAPPEPDPMLFFQLMGIYAAVVAAVPQWKREADAGAGVFSAAAATPSLPGKKGKKKSSGEGGGPSQPEPSSSATKAFAAAGLRLAVELMARVAPGRSLLPSMPNSVFAFPRQAMRSLDVMLYDMLEAAQPEEDVLGVLAAPELRAVKGMELQSLLAKMGWRDGPLPPVMPATTTPAPAVAATGAAAAATVASPGKTGAVAPAAAGGCPRSPSPGPGPNAAAGAAMAAVGAAATAVSSRPARQCAVCGVREGDPGFGKLLKCGGCLVARYCSEGCQSAAWPQHKRECKALAAAKRQRQQRQQTERQSV